VHELALSESIVELVADCARREGMRRVTGVRIEVGAGAAVDAAALAFCFPIAAEGSVVEGAALSISHVPLRAICEACGECWQPGDIASLCPACRSADRRFIDGRQMRVVHISGA
jgi:hydrogenase nickel incorporation protein HypA/HybF